MEEQNSKSTTIDVTSPLSKPAGGQVMDIQTKPLGSPAIPVDMAQKVAVEESTQDVDTIDTLAEPPPEEVAVSDVTEEASNTSEAAETTAAESTETSNHVSTADEPNPSESTNPTSETPPPATHEHDATATPPAPHKKGKPVLVIAIAIVVALGLAALVVFTFMKTKKDTVGTNKTANSTTTQTAAKPLASPADVDSTSKELETSLSKVDDSKDFSSADLSDKSLGL